ncbi:hypothetical protein TUMEXPCC7403_01600 [Tumidithrix helvetica PCC 7403]|uniref:pentapeptide repeat-containing protein n=1 Tax=Tumidithrix helvetica TaxID=3457545 RepID=UPI003C866F1C
MMFKSGAIATSNYLFVNFWTKSMIEAKFWWVAAIVLGMQTAIAAPVFADQVDRLLSTRSCPECNLSNANFDSAALNGANLSQANLRSANFSNANLIGGNLTGANLFQANLYNANLRGANFTNADLSDVDLTKADLTNARLTDAVTKGTNLRNAKLCRTIMPDNSINNQNCRTQGY